MEIIFEFGFKDYRDWFVQGDYALNCPYSKSKWCFYSERDSRRFNTPDFFLNSDDEVKRVEDNYDLAFESDWQCIPLLAKDLHVFTKKKYRYVVSHSVRPSHGRNKFDVNKLVLSPADGILVEFDEADTGGLIYYCAYKIKSSEESIEHFKRYGLITNIIFKKGIKGLRVDEKKTKIDGRLK